MKISITLLQSRTLVWIISLACAVAATGWVLAFPWTARNTYISENSLQPGSAASRISDLDIRYALEFSSLYHKELLVSNKSFSHELIQNEMNRIGVSSHLHSFEDTFGIKGTNIYTILRSPRADGSEGILIVVPAQTREGLSNAIAIGVAFSYAKYIKDSQWLAKDITILFTDCDDPPNMRDRGLLAWLSDLHSGKLDANGGVLFAGMALEIGSHNPYDAHVLVEGINAQQPNLDLANIVISIGSQNMLPFRLNAWPHINLPWNEMNHMIRFMLLQATSIGTGSHSILNGYRVDSVTMKIGSGGYGSGGNSDSVGKTLRTLDTVLRSINGLLERFHQSFFLYIMTSEYSFKAIEDFLPAYGLIFFGGILPHALYLFLAGGPITLPIISMLVSAMITGGTCLALPYVYLQIGIFDLEWLVGLTVSGWMVIVVLAVLLMRRMSREMTVSESSSLKSLSIFLFIISLLPFSVVNMSLGFGLSLLAFLLYIPLPPCSPSRSIRTFCTLLSILYTIPISIPFISTYFGTSSWKVLSFIIIHSITHSDATLAVLTCVVLPLQLLSFMWTGGFIDRTKKRKED